MAPKKPAKKRRRPRLTRLAVEGLRRVYNDAEVMLDERVGCGDESLSSVEYRGSSTWIRCWTGMMPLIARSDSGQSLGRDVDSQ